MLGKMFWKEHTYKNSEKRHANTSLRGDSIGSLKCVYRCVYKYNIYIIYIMNSITFSVCSAMPDLW